MDSERSDGGASQQAHVSEILPPLRDVGVKERGDFVACVLLGYSCRERAVERGVKGGTVSSNVNSVWGKIEQDLDRKIESVGGVCNAR